MRLATVIFLALTGSIFAQKDGVKSPVAKHKQPGFTFEIKEHYPGVPRGKERWLVGHVHVFKKDIGKDAAPSSGAMPDQVIEIVMNVSAASFVQFGIGRPDLNCDGLLDIQVLQHGGSKWGNAHVWLYDPQTSTFIATKLTRDLARLPHNSYRIDAKTRRLHLRWFRGVPEWESVYRITPKGLEFESKKEVEE